MSATNSAEVDLTWSASTDNVAVQGYDVYRDGSPVTSVTVATLRRPLPYPKPEGRPFDIRASNELWQTDLSAVWCGEDGWSYLTSANTKSKNRSTGQKSGAGSSSPSREPRRDLDLAPTVGLSSSDPVGRASEERAEPGLEHDIDEGLRSMELVGELLGRVSHGVAEHESDALDPRQRQEPAAERIARERPTERIAERFGPQTLVREGAE